LHDDIHLLEIRLMAESPESSWSRDLLADADNAADLTRRERRKLEVRSRILEASVRLFEAQGIEATTVAEITERADVAHKTFFNHFPSKQHLLREIAYDGVDLLLVDIESVRKEQQSTPERLLQFFRQVAEHTAEGGPMNRELVTELVHALNGGDEKSEQALKLIDAFGSIVRDGLAAGDVTRRHDAETLTEMILGAYYVLMFNWANLEGYPLHERALEPADFLTDAMTTG